MKLAHFVTENRKALVTLTVLLCILGGYFALRLPVAIFPQLTVPRIAISGQSGDIPLAATLTQLTRPLEGAVSTVPGVVRVYSSTIRGSDSLEVTFADGTDMPLALQRLQANINEIQASFPPNTTVSSAILNPSLFPIMGYSLTYSGTGGSAGDRMDLVALRNLALYTIRPQLARLPGVAQIRVTGGDVPEYVVAVRPEAMRARGLTLQDVTDALARANRIASVGQFTRSYQQYEVLVSGLLTNADDIRSVAIAAKNHVPIFVSDVANVRMSVEKRTVLATGDGKPAVVLNVVKQPDANTLQVAEEIHAALETLKPTLPAGVATSRFYDQSEIVAQSESSVVESIVIGGVLALVILVLFLGNLRVAVIVLLQLPLSLLITFILMRFLGQTLNIMTLGALAIAMGLVIDDGIVVVETIYHHLELGESRAEAVAVGMAAITPALVGSSLTTIVTFLPLTLLGGVTGQFFGPLALVMIATLLVSLTLALLVTPLLSGIVLPKRLDTAPGEEGKPVPRRSLLARLAGFFPHLFDLFTAEFAKILLFCIRFRWLVLLFTIGALVGSYLLFQKLPTGFFPEFDEGAFVIDYHLKAGTSLDETDRDLKLVEGMLKETPEVAAWSRLTGARSGSGLELSEQNQGDCLVRLKPDRTRPGDDIMTDLRKQIEATFPGQEFELIQMLQDGLGDIAGTPSPIEVKIYGPDMATLTQLAHQAGSIVAGTPGVVEENDGIIESGPETILKVDPRRAALAGLSTDAITNAATGALLGTVATSVQQGEAAVGVRVRAANSPGGDPIATLPDIPIAAPGNPPVPLGSVASLTVVPGTPQITRENQQQMVSITARLEGRDLGSGIADVQSRLKSGFTVPPGYRMEFGGLYASQQESFRQLATVLLITILLVSTMLLIVLRSFKQAFVLLLAGVLSLGGVVAALTLTGTPLNLTSFTGAIMVVGIVTEDGIVFFDVVNHLRKRHPEQPIIETVLEARRLRLRPILMTILAAILALLPLAQGIGAGAAMQKPLAIAVIGGLAASTLFTLLVAPTFFVVLEGTGRKPRS